MEEHRTTDQLIIAELHEMRRDFNDFKTDINNRMAPLDKLKGFWSVMGFVLGGLTLVAAGFGGFIYIIKLVQTHIK